jgi:phosphoribosyl-AMP cyclohydrolase
MNKQNQSITDITSSLLVFNPEGLIPAIAQQHDTGEVLMMAWMNSEAIELSIAENRAVYWSRSRQQLWRKGETSGQIQYIKEIRWDCDGDTLLLQVDQTGVACHTGRRSCFFNAIRDNRIKTISSPEIDPNDLYK